MPVVCAEFAQFLSITCSKRGRRFFWEDLTFLSSIFALPRCSSCFSPDSLSPSNTRQSSFLYHDCFSMWMPFCILDITCETWKIVILNYGFMVLAGHWPQTKALIIWGLRWEQEVGTFNINHLFFILVKLFLNMKCCHFFNLYKM